MTSPTVWRTILVSRAAREATFGAGATVDRRLLVHAAATCPVAKIDPVPPVLGEPPVADAALATWYASTWRWNAVRPDDLAWALAYAFGPGTYATLDGTAKRHTIIPGAEWELPSFCAEEMIGQGWHDRYTGGMLGRIRLVGGVDATAGSRYGVGMEAKLLFAVRTAGSGAGTTVDGEPVWNFPQSHLWIGSAYDGTSLLGETNLTGATDLSAQWMGFIASFDNQVDVDHATDFSTSELARAERGERHHNLKLSLEIADRTLLDKLTNETLYGVEIGWASGVLAGETVQQYGAHLIWPKVRLAQAAAHDGVDGRLTADLAWQILCDPTYGPFIGIIWNRTAPYAG